jgi:hypothetical protein
MATKKQHEEVISRLEGLDANLTSLTNRITSLEQLLAAANKTNAMLLKSIEAKDQKISGLQLKVNQLEQHHRSWSIRVHGLKFSEEEERSAPKVKEILYDRVIRPILAGAVEHGDLESVPEATEVIEHAHVLPGNAKHVSKPVIARFFVRNIRSLVFKHKREYAPRDRSQVLRSGAPGRNLYSIFEDLTKMNFNKMRELADHPQVGACWTIGGQIKYKLVNSERVRSVKNILDTADKILGINNLEQEAETETFEDASG